MESGFPVLLNGLSPSATIITYFGAQIVPDLASKSPFKWLLCVFCLFVYFFDMSSSYFISRPQILQAYLVIFSEIWISVKTYVFVFFLENNIRNQELGHRYTHYFWGVIIPRLSQQIELGSLCMFKHYLRICTHKCKHSPLGLWYPTRRLPLHKNTLLILLLPWQLEPDHPFLWACSHPCEGHTPALYYLLNSSTQCVIYLV